VLGRAVAAKILPGRADLAKSIIGTAAYPAPEQVTTGAVSAATDVYALGVVANERLTGRRPFAAETPPAIALKHTHTEPLRDRAHPRPASNRS
jgi:serine/threonine-protein kinase